MTRPQHRVGEMAWNAWGDPGQARTLNDSVRQLITQALSVTTEAEAPVPEADLSLAPSALPDAAHAALTTVVGTEHVLTDATTRVLRTGGKSTPDLLRRRAGDVASAPDAVVRPGTHQEVEEVLAACAWHQIAVVPFGGGTSVVGGVEPLRGRFASLISLDLRRLDRLVELDTESGTATLEAGLRTPEAEELLNAEGFTLGHYPQSYEFATIGGYAATRSSGQASAGYGRFDDMVTGLRVATPRGTLDLGRAPASAAGPDLRQLFLGSEGAFGVITEVTVRVRRVPEGRRDEAWSFPDFARGVAAVRALAQSGALPTSIRISDETETFVNAAVAGSSAPEGCLAVVGYEGNETRIAERRAAVDAVLREHGASPLSEDTAGDWRRSRFSGPYLRDALLDTGILSETLETAANWADITRLRERVTAALTESLGADGPAPVVFCHLSHAYPSGASLYFTVATDAGAEPEKRWRAAKRSASDAIAASGATITHHHAVGVDHAPWMEAEIGPLGVEVLAAVKKTVDPLGVLNPGKLIPTTS
ncbi:FAD-binding oxidoreductase [Streptomyces sp. NPDC048639]|uniref:FAD-binding oxidoreductase n=1 Tax=Streptomyces sp. NPDC048639 TaxID=3365581 RepID=UPI003717157E